MRNFSFALLTVANAMKPLWPPTNQWKELCGLDRSKGRANVPSFQTYNARGDHDNPRAWLSFSVPSQSDIFWRRPKTHESACKRLNVTTNADADTGCQETNVFTFGVP